MINENSENRIFKGYNTLSSYTTRGLTWLASTILTTAIQGGGTVLNKIKYNILEVPFLFN